MKDVASQTRLTYRIFIPIQMFGPNLLNRVHLGAAGWAQSVRASFTQSYRRRHVWLAGAGLCDWQLGVGFDPLSG